MHNSSIYNFQLSCTDNWCHLINWGFPWDPLIAPYWDRPHIVCSSALRGRRLVDPDGGVNHRIREKDREGFIFATIYHPSFVRSVRSKSVTIYLCSLYYPIPFVTLNSLAVVQSLCVVYLLNTGDLYRIGCEAIFTNIIHYRYDSVHCRWWNSLYSILWPCVLPVEFLSFLW